MSSNEASGRSRHDAVLLLLGAVATGWSAIMFLQWGLAAADTGFRTPPLIQAAADTPLRKYPDDPGGIRAPQEVPELQLAVARDDAASVWRHSRLQSAPAPDPGPHPGVLPASGLPQSHPAAGGNLPRSARLPAGDESAAVEPVRATRAGPEADPGPGRPDPLVDAAGADADGELIQPLPADGLLVLTPAGDGAVTDRQSLPEFLQRPPDPRPGA